MHTSPPPPILTLADLKTMCHDAGADDAGVVALDRPELADQRAAILRLFPGTRAVLSYVCRMNREPVRNPARSLANVEFHRTGDWVNEVGHTVVAALERRGVRALNPPAGFPMEAERWGEQMWVLSHKPIAVAAGLGQMGIHRNVIHPQFGNFIVLGSVLIADEVADETRPIDFNPCLNCLLCVAACPVGAVQTDGGFDFSSCYHHNYREFMGGFADWVEQVAESRNRMDYRRRVTPAETVSLWQSLGFGPNYKAAYCMAVCPAGEDVIGAYRRSKAVHTQEVVRPLQNKVEPIYVIPGSDAEAYVKKRYPHKTVRPIRGSLFPYSIEGFLRGLRLTFQRTPAAGLAAIYRFSFTTVPGSAGAVDATVEIRDQNISVTRGFTSPAQVTVRADAGTWLRIVRGEAGIVGALLRRKVRVAGSIRLLRAFERCFPK